MVVLLAAAAAGWLARLAGRGGLLVGGPQLGGQRGEFRLEAAARVGTGQSADLHRGAVLGRRTRRGGAGADEDPPTADHEREQQPAQGGDAADQGGQLARVVRDGQAHPGDVAGERDRAPAVRQLQRLARLEHLRAGRQPVHGGGIEFVDGLRRAAVHAQVPGVGDQADRRIVGRGEHRFQRAADVHRGRHEDAGEAELFRLGVGNLHHALGEEVARRAGDERRGLLVHHVTAGVGDRELRRVPVPDEVHLRAVHRQRTVDVQVKGASRAARMLGVRDPRVERRRLAALLAGGYVAGVEPVQRHRERAQVGGGDEPARVPLVERADGVGEALALHQQPVRLVTEQPAERHRHQHSEQGQVEEQVARLAQVPLLGRDPVLRAVGVVRAPEPEPAAGQHPRRHLDRLLRRQRGGVLGGPGQPGQVTRGPRRQRPRRAGQPEGTRHHAADEGGEQQQVDGGEPGRGEDVEEPEPVQPRREVRMRRVVLLDAGRVAALLRQHRSGHAGQGQQEQQDQRDPHRRELPPRPFQPVGGTERGPGRGRAGARMVVRFGRRVEGICFRCAHIGHRLIPPPR